VNLPLGILSIGTSLGEKLRSRLRGGRRTRLRNLAVKPARVTASAGRGFTRIRQSRKRRLCATAKWDAHHSQAWVWSPIKEEFLIFDARKVKRIVRVFRKINFAGAPILVVFCTTEPALSEVEGVGILTFAGWRLW